MSCFFLFFSGHRLDVHHTSTHDVVLVRSWNVGLICAARGSLQMQDPKIAKIGHLGTIAQFCRAISSQLRHMSTIGKIVKQQCLTTCLHNMVNFGPLAEICWRVWGATANFNGFCILAAKVCIVEQRAPPTFGRATITLGIGPHSSLLFFVLRCVNPDG